MSIITKQGDKGFTRLASGEKVKKSGLRLDVLGTLDELNAQLGLAHALMKRIPEKGSESLCKEIFELQIELFRMGSEIASKNPKKNKNIKPTLQEHVREIEDRIHSIESHIELPPFFIIPGACEASAAIDCARATARRLERSLCKLAEKGGYKNRQGLIYINRISDYLFLLARAIEKCAGISFHTK